MSRSVAVLSALLLAVTACQSSSADSETSAPREPRPRFANAPTRGCEESVSGDLGRDWRDSTIVVGPLGLVAIWYANESDKSFRHLGKNRYRGQKVLVLVRRGKTVTLVVPEEARRVVSLLYDPDRWRMRNAYRVAEGNVVTTFRACEGVFGVRPHEYTQFNGAIVVAGARCVPLDVYAEGSDEPLRAMLSFGAGRCG
jgi:hypothetical protein